ncbi:hypothetical protein FA09DRAFT_331660 [Tilletiopsis washingtonensis]|jgi:hypothetical protein|uniref:Ig-like domain-containing protein n=1 Tax=Tilletiopsis washingtonensis TaxID=58919 RepID=A0A316Z2Q8_9BASI|nr:hypothetical protein FA09DRAFT_331660 [Tilletiopsis washingtonensis]PWN96070.1 hypothetical protein FA09DRAFT_331660 [Tilletiopsis washingtonensis]
MALGVGGVSVCLFASSCTAGADGTDRETYQWKRETNALGMSGGKAGFACDIVRKPDPSVA